MLEGFSVLESVRGVEVFGLMAEDLVALPNEFLADLEVAVRDALEALEDDAARTVVSEARLGQKALAVAGVQAGEVDSLSRRLQDGDIDLVGFDAGMQDSIAANFRKAYTLERGAPLDAGDLEYLRRATAAEMVFARKFGRDIDAGALIMPRAERAAMYGRTIDGIAWHARTEAQPDDVRVSWQLGAAEHCPDCLILACFLTDHLQIETGRGILPFVDVVVGDEVFTHRRRWRRVLAKPIRRSIRSHRYAVLRTETGLVGLTDDHRLRIVAGWKSAREVADDEDRVLRMSELWGGEEGRSQEVVQEMCCSRTGKAPAAVIREVGVGRLKTRSDEEPVCRELLAGRETGSCLAAPMGLGEGERPGVAGQSCASQEWRLLGRSVGELGVKGSGRTRPTSQLRREVSQLEGGSSGILLRGLREDVQCLQEGDFGTPILFPGVCPARSGGTRQDSDGLCGMREAVYSAKGCCCFQEDAGERQRVLLSVLLSEAQVAGDAEHDPALRLLRENLQMCLVEDQELEIGQCVLLKGMLPEGTELHDLMVEEDHSFIANGMVVHNSNSPYNKWNLPTTPRAGATQCLSSCECWLRYVSGKASAAERANAAEYALRKDQSLADLMRPSRPPKGLRAATAGEARYIQALRNRINFQRRRIAQREGLTDNELATAIRARREANRALIEFTEREGIHEVPLMSVDEVIDSRHLGRRALGDLFRNGIDGRSLTVVERRRLESVVMRFEEEIGEVFSEAEILARLGIKT